MKKHYFINPIAILLFLTVPFVFTGIACDEDDIVDDVVDSTETVPPGVSIYSVYDDEIDEYPVGPSGTCPYRCDMVPIQFDVMSVPMEAYVAVPANAAFQAPYMWAYYYIKYGLSAPSGALPTFSASDPASTFTQDARSDLIAGARLLLANQEPADGLKYEDGEPVPEGYSICINSSCSTPLGSPLAMLAPLQFYIYLVDDTTLVDDNDNYVGPSMITSTTCRSGRFFTVTSYDQSIPFRNEVWWGGSEDDLVAVVYDKYGYPNGEYWPCTVLNDRYSFIETDYSNNLIVSENKLVVEKSGEKEDMVIIRGGSGTPDNTDTFCTLHEFDMPFPGTYCTGCMDNYDDGPDSYPGMDEPATTMGELFSYFVIGGPLQTLEGNTNGTMSSLASFWTVYFNDNPDLSSGLRSCEMTKYLNTDPDYNYYVRVQLSPSSSQISLDIGCYFLIAYTSDQFIPSTLCSGIAGDYPSPGPLANSTDDVTIRLIRDTEPEDAYLDDIYDFDWYKLEWDPENPVPGSSGSSSSSGG